jgi:hypothetical protein
LDITIHKKRAWKRFISEKKVSLKFRQKYLWVEPKKKLRKRSEKYLKKVLLCVRGSDNGRYRDRFVDNEVCFFGLTGNQIILGFASLNIGEMKRD